MYESDIASRAVGQYPLSIATSLAIESACGIHPEIVVKTAPILKYDELYVNLRTLHRNFLGSLDKTIVGGIVPPQIAATIKEEMEMIQSIIREKTNGRTKVVYYLSNYNFNPSRYKLGVLRMDNTDKQKDATRIEKFTMDILLSWNKTEGLGILVFDLKLKPPTGHPKTMIITHYAFDLLSYHDFGELVLLESHTGSIKPRALWYQKFYNGKELNMIPFREDMIQVFGDSSSFRPASNELKKEVIEIAKKYNWSSITTLDKIRYGIDQMKNQYARDLLKQALLS